MKKNIKTKNPMTPDMVQMANAKIAEFLSKQNFDSIEEANEFLNKHLLGKDIDELFFNKKGNKTNIEKSEDLIYEAYESSPAKGLKLAKQALELDSENIRALIYLADREKNIDEALKLYLKTFQVAERKLGEKIFKQNRGHFWLLHETRPFMTAKFNYANCLRSLERTDEAIKIYYELLDLNPNDNQGVRYMLSGALLLEERFTDYLKLFNSFKEKTTFWLFNYALYLFLTQGDSKESIKALKAANKSNPQIIKMITMRKQITADIPIRYSSGSEEEAICYLYDNITVWLKNKESIYWLINFSENTKLT